MNKTRNNQLIVLADNALRTQAEARNLGDGISKILNMENDSIEDAYNGAIAALSVAVAMSELRPALAFYYQDKKSGAKPKANRRSVLDVIGRMICSDENATDAWRRDISANGRYAENLLRYSIKHDEPQLKKEVIDCAIALKQVVRTYNLV